MFNEQFVITIRDINYGQHLDHISLLGYLHETRVRYLRVAGCAEDNVDGHGSILIVSNLTCNYKKECFYGDTINVQLELCKESELKLIFKYAITQDRQTIATAQITTVFINTDRKPIKIPKNLLPS